MLEFVPNMFVVSWQDYRSHKFGDPKPYVTKERIAWREKAETRKVALQELGMIACVTPLVIKRRKQTIDA